MKIKIKKNASEIYYSIAHHEGGFNKEYYEMLKKIDGETVVVETEHLFRNQFNTVPLIGVSKLGLRVMEKYVEEVIDDERKTKMKCHYCGLTQDLHIFCKKCEDTKLIRHITPLSAEAAASLTYMVKADGYRSVGSTCEVNEELPFVAVTIVDGNMTRKYFLKEDSAQAVITNFKKEHASLCCSIEDYLLVVYAEWE